ncbi:hypothetical protein QQF64_018774 [Cirrhinus molitorella]|uniref:TSC22 domain family member 2 n=1 Tax=Cirrhinus molitorella TaxID=172907 RepID=A0ABR3LDN5_9TELE
MSKMPSKKKSCFQITSVTQAAQVAANSNTDDTESLDDPDEPRTEDMSSSEIYDMSKGGDFEPETCDVSLSDESLHNEAETADGPIGSRNTNAVHTNPNVRAVTGPVSSQSSASVASNATSQTSSSATVSSCSSRFRVIKLDHGTGEPFKRGRWTCAEFYERDTDASSSSAWTVDSVKHTSTTDHSADIGGGSVTAHVGLSTPAVEAHTDSGYISAPSNPPVELQQQTFNVSPQGLVAQNLYADAHIKSPSMPSTTQPQPFFPGKQVQKPGQILQTVIPSNQPPVSVTSLPLMTPLNQGPSPVMTPAAGSAHMLVDSRGLPISQPEHVQGLLQQTALGTVSAAAVVQQAPVPLIQPAVTMSVSPHGVVPGVQNVPVVMSSASNTPQSMPKQTLVPQQNQPQGVHSGLGVQTTPANFSQLPTGVAKADENQRKPDGLFQSAVLIGKDAIKPLNPEGLQLPTPAVNSLFGIAIPIDGDEDR